MTALDDCPITAMTAITRDPGDFPPLPCELFAASGLLLGRKICADAGMILHGKSCNAHLRRRTIQVKEAARCSSYECHGSAPSSIGCPRCSAGARRSHVPA